MLKKKNTSSYYTLSNIQYCAVRRALCIGENVLDREVQDASKKREQMIVSIMGSEGRDAIEFCKELFSPDAVGGTSTFTANLRGDLAKAVQVYIEYELADLKSLRGDPVSLKLKCGHAVAEHIRALNALWKKFPKVPKNKKQ